MLLAGSGIVTTARAELLLQLHNNTALSGGSSAAPVAGLGEASARLGSFQSATLQGQLTTKPQWTVFSVEADHPGAYVRLWVDDHLMLDEAIVPAGPAPSPAGPPGCAHPGGTPVRRGTSHWGRWTHWKLWQGVDLPTQGTDDPHSMRGDGGDCTSGCSLESCVALCDKLQAKGCVGFTTSPGSFEVCYMRKLSSVGGDSCEKQLHTGHYDSYTRDSCINSTTFCPHAGTPSPSPAPPPELPGVAAYSIPVPFLPGFAYSKLRMEVTTAAVASPITLTLKMNGTAVPNSALVSTVAAPELKYHSERALAERGWNTWLSGDMLTHALLPHGIAVSMALHAGNSSVDALCSQGPSCDATKFPAKHGLHAVRGEYTEIESVSVGGGAAFRVETAASGGVGSGDLNVLITTLALPHREAAAAAAVPVYAVVTLHVPDPYKPRVCDVTAAAGGLRSECPGFPAVEVVVADGTMSTVTSGSTLQVELSPRVGGQVALLASPSLGGETAAAAAGAGAGPGAAVAAAAAGGGNELATSGSGGAAPPSVSKIAAAVGSARATLLKSFAQYGARNETFAGMQTSISWNVIYTP